MSPSVVKKVKPTDGIDVSLKRNVLVKINIDPEGLGKNLDVIGVLEEVNFKKKHMSSVTYRVDVLYDAPSFDIGDNASSVYFSFRLEHIPSGQYKFRLTKSLFYISPHPADASQALSSSDIRNLFSCSAIFCLSLAHSSQKAVSTWPRLVIQILSPS